MDLHRRSQKTVDLDTSTLGWLIPIQPHPHWKPEAGLSFICPTPPSQNFLIHSSFPTQVMLPRVGSKTAPKPQCPCSLKFHSPGTHPPSYSAALKAPHDPPLPPPIYRCDSLRTPPPQFPRTQSEGYRDLMPLHRATIFSAPLTTVGGCGLLRPTQSLE